MSRLSGSAKWEKIYLVVWLLMWYTVVWEKRVPGCLTGYMVALFEKNVYLVAWLVIRWCRVRETCVWLYDWLYGSAVWEKRVSREKRVSGCMAVYIVYYSVMWEKRVSGCLAGYMVVLCEGNVCLVVWLLIWQCCVREKHKSLTSCNH